jgi:diaminopimelate decarboxylase
MDRHCLRYDLDAVARRAAELQAGLPEGSRLYYSFKANPLPAIARELRLAGVRAEITSAGELMAAQNAGFETDIVLGGPGKTEKVIETALRQGVRHVFVRVVHGRGADFQTGTAGGRGSECDAAGESAQAPDARLAMSGVESQFGLMRRCCWPQARRSSLKLPELKL